MRQEGTSVDHLLNYLEETLEEARVTCHLVDQKSKEIVEDLQKIGQVGLKEMLVDQKVDMAQVGQMVIDLLVEETAMIREETSDLLVLIKECVHQTDGMRTETWVLNRV